MITEPGDMIIFVNDIAITDAIDAAKTINSDSDISVMIHKRVIDCQACTLPMDQHDNCQTFACRLSSFAKEVRCILVAPPGNARDRPVK